ncbi:hypothetical protein BKA65DRAFT_194670 [Rhexocercosporidium sp. MPI-PUGE-AT-0058]|nr:hypothetical protein BKA65DRAFT_194670 [Rhexocercosporidium sp. MPI-PUGE-AT-0058]
MPQMAPCCCKKPEFIHTLVSYGYISKLTLRPETISLLIKQNLLLHRNKVKDNSQTTNAPPSSQQSSRFLHQYPIQIKMCDYEKFTFNCGHSAEKLLSYCHFARNDIYHQCFGVKVTKNIWSRNYLCPPCEQIERQRQAAINAQAQRYR